ncbi:dihydroneopterin aldolase [Chelatococcus sp. SYSU_G07232]|uniref:7,8-dihydroneopterin aldolase n=1 Tax=Chelatococcus albus TaxID=3047466 RepID=A0ABT7AJ59_9HYPH|nr:dihydroneopterin aldolase [Chelatococcus sp. SYSU_G07232]MDJ1159420.1 dihydroneopterin aldolase [Chelatococcus sp. SYSU_G07232]
MSDRITVHGLTVRANHGIMAEERSLGQRFVLDLTAKLDLAAAMRSDRLADSVCYATMVDVAVAAFSERHYNLIEAAAGAVAEAILGRFPIVASVEVTVEKPNAPINAVFRTVAITIERSRERPARD